MMLANDVLIAIWFIPLASLEQGVLNMTAEPTHTKQWLGSLNTTHHRSPRRKRQAPGTVWPEVLLVVDYDSFMLHGATSRDVKRYFISFWNGVDLRYKLLTHPQIRVSLAGMIVAKVIQSSFEWRSSWLMMSVDGDRIAMLLHTWNEIDLDLQTLTQWTPQEH